VFDEPRIQDRPPDRPRSPARRYPDGARRIAAAVLAAHPMAYAVAFDTYVDDDTMDCGPVVDAEGRTLLADVSDLDGEADIEGIVAGWSATGFLTAADPCFGVCPVTGRPLLLLPAALAAGDEPRPGAA